VTSPTFDALPDAEQGAIAERINEALFAYYRHPRQTVPGVTLDDVVMINAANHRLYGEIDETSFCCEIGDMNGFLMESWGDEPAEPPAPPDPIVLGPQLPPRSADMAKAARVFLSRDDVREAERARAYDAMFSPGVVTQRHYDAVAARLGCEWMPKSERDRLLAVKP